MILSGRTIKQLEIVHSFTEKTILHGMSYGVSSASYDFRIREALDVEPGHFLLGSTMEHLTMPFNVGGRVMDKSTLARLGLSLFNTWIDPGFIGYLTIELSNRGPDRIRLPAGSPCGQIVFEFTDETHTNQGYTGKYQGQGPTPVAAIMEDGRRFLTGAAPS